MYTMTKEKVMEHFERSRLSILECNASFKDEEAMMAPLEAAIKALNAGGVPYSVYEAYYDEY